MYNISTEVKNMKLLYVKASGFKNIQNDCVLDFTAKSKKIKNTSFRKSQTAYSYITPSRLSEKTLPVKLLSLIFSIALIPYSATFRSKIKIILMTEFT